MPRGRTAGNRTIIEGDEEEDSEEQISNVRSKKTLGRRGAPAAKESKPTP